MKTDPVHALTDSFESQAQQADNSVEFDKMNSLFSVTERD